MTIRPRGKSASLAHPGRNSRSRLMMAASAGILTLFGPPTLGIYGGQARAQTLPTGCTDGDNDTAEDGETITCVAPPSNIGSISTNVDDLTVILGDGTTPTAIQSNTVRGNVVLNGNGDQTLNVNAGVTFVDGSVDNYSPIVQVSATDGDLTINNAATISGAYGGVVADHNGSGSVLIDNSGTIGSTSSYTGLEVTADGTDGLISINNSGLITSNGVALEIDASAADADIVIENSGTISASFGDGLFVDAGTSDADIVIDNTGTIRSSNTGIALDVRAGTGDVTITSPGVLDGGQQPGLNVSGGGTVDISLGDVSGGSGAAVLLNGADSIDFTSDGVIGPIEASNFGSATFRVNEMTGNASVFNVGAATTSLTIESETAGSGSLSNSANFEVNSNSDAIIDIDIHDAQTIRMTNFGGGFNLTSTGTVRVVECGSQSAAPTLCDGGPVTLNLNDVVGENPTSAAIYLRTETTHTEDISVTIAGEIRGTALIENAGAGDSIVNVNNLETLALGAAAEYRDGINIYHQNTSSGDIEITSAGLINVGNSENYAAIIADNHGTGSTTVNVNNVSAYNDDYGDKPGSLVNNDGVRVYTTNTASDVSVTTSGTVSATGIGVSVSSNGTAAATAIEVNDVASSEEQAVYASHGGSGDLTVQVNGDVDGGTQGIETINSGLGVTDITLAAGATVTGQGAEGIRATSTNAASNIIVQGSSGDVVGATDGIYLYTDGADINVQSLDSVTGQAGDGLDLRSRGGDIAVDDVGTILGTGGNGVFAASEGGNISVTEVGSITGTNNNGVFANSNGGDLTISGVGAISGTNNDGIFAGSNGGDITISDVDTISGTDGTGLFASSGGGDLTISDVDAISGTDGDGVFASSNGGDITISDIGTIDSQGSDGIEARSGSATGTGNISIQDVGSINSDGYGIRADATDSGNYGDVNIGGVTAIGDVTSRYDTGIFADGRNVNITVAGDVNAYFDGVTAVGSESVSIFVDNVTSTTLGGILGRVEPNGESLSITSTGTVSGSQYGVYANNQGTGDTTLYAVDVTGGAGYYGIGVNHSGANLDITVTGTVTGGTEGIVAFHSGTGDTNITLGPNATVTGQSDEGIRVTSVEATSDITVQGSSGNVIGATDGMYLSTSGADITVQNLDSVTGQAGDGLDLRSRGGDITVTGVDTILGTGGNGMRVLSGGGDVSIQGVGLVGGVEGTTINGISVSSGTGAINIGDVDAIGDVSGQDNGVEAFNTYGGGPITINTSGGTVTGGDTGINTFNYGDGATSITAADVIGQTGIGILGVNNSNTTDMSITSTGSVEGGEYGILGASYGSGALVINAVDVTGTTSNGIYALNGGNSTDIVINATGTVSGGRAGMRVNNYGTGSTTITTADVSSSNGYGLLSYGSASTTDLTIDTSAGSVSGAYEGIAAQHFGSGDLSITANNVEALAGGDDAIDAYNSANGGSLSITTAGNITSANDDGIDAVNFGTDLSISVSGALTGYQGGIEAYNFGTGATTINVTGSVEGQTEIGIFTVSQNGATITVSDGGSVTGATNAIVTDGGTSPGEPADDVLTIMAGGTVVGDALLLAGNDVFNDEGGSYTTVFGGDGVDTVNFSGTGRTINGSGGTGDTLQEFEIFNFTTGGFNLTGVHSGLSEVNFLTGSNTVDGSIDATTTTVATDASLDLADGTDFSGELINNGTLSLGGGSDATASVGSFTQGADGIFVVTADGAGSDTLVVSGDVALAGELDIVTVSGLEVGETTSTLIDGGTGLSGTFDTLSDGVLINQSLEYDTTNFDVLLTTTVNSASTIVGMNDNQSNVGDYLIDLLADPNLDEDLLEFVFALGTNSDADEVAAILDNLTPEDIDQAMRFMDVSQRDFMRSLLSLDAGDSIASRDAGVRFASLAGGAVAPGEEDDPFLWISSSATALSDGSSSSNRGFDGQYFQLRGGVGGLSTGTVEFGVAAAYSDYSGDGDGPLGDDVDAETFSVAGTVGAPLAIGRIDGVLAYSGGETEMMMRLIDPGSMQTITQQAETDISSISLRTKLTLDGIDRTDWSLTPHVQAGFTQTEIDDFVAGDGTAAISVMGSSNSRGDIGLGATYYRQWKENVALHTSVTGVRYFGDTENSFTSQFVLAPADGDSFTTIGADVRWQAEIETGLDWNVGNGFSLRASFFSELGDLTAYGGRAGITRSF